MVATFDATSTPIFKPPLAACSAGGGEEVAAMPMRFFGAFDPEAITAMSEALEAAFEELRYTGPPEVVREIIATRIIAAIRLGQRDPARLLQAALREPD
jgi:hypothetical protein